MIEEGVSHIAYFRLDGGSSKLYTQEYVDEKDKEIKRLKEEYVMLQNASDEVEEELQQRIDKAIEYLESYNTDFKNCRFGEAPISIRELGDLLDILKGS